MDIAALVCAESINNNNNVIATQQGMMASPSIQSMYSFPCNSLTALPTLSIAKEEEGRSSGDRSSGDRSTLSSNISRRVSCTLCGKTFSGVSSHNRHVSRTHHKARPFRCTECPQSFGQKGSLERHISGVHKKERPFSCPHCGKGFGRSDNLRIHISTVHMKERPFQCSACSKSFGGERPLKIHWQTVHLKQRPLECAICLRRFGQRSNLNAHIRHVHKKDPSSGGTDPLTGIIRSSAEGLGSTPINTATLSCSSISYGLSSASFATLPPIHAFSANPVIIPTSPASSGEHSLSLPGDLDNYVNNMAGKNYEVRSLPQPDSTSTWSSGAF